jgi:hypothetical protein
MKYLSQEQVNQIQGRLKLKGHNTVTLAALLGRPWSTVAGVINGNKRTAAVRAEIAAFLEIPETELFGGNGQDSAVIQNEHAAIVAGSRE